MRVPVLGVYGNFKVWSTAGFSHAVCFMLLCDVALQGSGFNTLELTIAALKGLNRFVSFQ